MGTILLPIRILIQICGWRSDRLVDPIKIKSMASPTLRPKTCCWPVVSQPLELSINIKHPVIGIHSFETIISTHLDGL